MGNSARRVISYATVLITLTCIFFCALLVYRFELAKITCYPVIAKRVGVDPTMDAVHKYGFAKMERGMDFDEGISRLKEIALVKISDEYFEKNTTWVMTIVTVCEFADEFGVDIKYETDTKKIIDIYFRDLSP